MPQTKLSKNANRCVSQSVWSSLPPEGLREFEGSALYSSFADAVRQSAKPKCTSNNKSKAKARKSDKNNRSSDPNAGNSQIIERGRYSCLRPFFMRAANCPQKVSATAFSAEAHANVPVNNSGHKTRWAGGWGALQIKACQGVLAHTVVFA